MPGHARVSLELLVVGPPANPLLSTLMPEAPCSQHLLACSFSPQGRCLGGNSQPFRILLNATTYNNGKEMVSCGTVAVPVLMPCFNPSSGMYDLNMRCGQTIQGCVLGGDRTAISCVYIEAKHAASCARVVLPLPE